MYSGAGSIASDMYNHLLSSNFKFSSPREFSKNKELMHSDLYNYQQQPPPLLQQQPQPSSNLARYRSAPSSFFASLLNDGVAGGGDDVYPSRESEMMFPIFDSGESDSNDLKFPKALKQEMTEAVNDYSSVSGTAPLEMVYATTPALANYNSTTSAVPSAENSFRCLSTSGNCSNLTRHSSSPAGFLSNLADEIGFGVLVSDVGNFRASNRTNIETSSKTSRLSNYMNFSSGPSSCSRFLPQITENGNGNKNENENENESIGTTSQQNGHLGSGPNGDHPDGRYHPKIHNDSTFNSLKRNREGEVKMFSNLNGLDTQNGDSKHYSSGLVHQLSLLSTSAEMARTENFLQFQQDSTPCKIRAKRGFATHPRSIAERVRRTRISERMKKLQELFPNMDKQANTADMLDLAVECIKDLQKEVQTLTETRAKCACPSKRKQTSPVA